MPNLSQIKKLGLSLGSKETYLAETIRRPNRIEVANLVDLNLGFPLDFDAITDRETIESIGNNLKNAIVAEDITSNNLFISIDHSLATIKILPIDPNFKENELKEHILWEFQQYLISPIEEYNFDYQKLPKTSFYDYPTILIVAVNKKIIDAVSRIASISDMNLKSININIFASINTLETNYKLKPGKKIASIQVTKDRLIFIILEGKTLLGFHTIPLKENSDEEISLESISDEISKNLRFLISDYESEKDKTNFDKVFLYRNNKEIDLNEILELENKSEFEILNPLKKLSISSELKDKIPPDSDYSELTESVGVTI
ncbi:type IV pilus biogenesis protein PilM [candidate division KSB1 bacterium]